MQPLIKKKELKIKDKEAQKIYNAKMYKMRKIEILTKQKLILVLSELLSKYEIYSNYLKWTVILHKLVCEFNQLYEPDFMNAD